MKKSYFILFLSFFFLRIVAIGQDTSPPLLTGFSPIPGTTWHQPEDPIIFGFNEPIKSISDGGNIKIYNQQTGDLFFSAKSTDEAVVISGSSMVVHPQVFDPETYYYVQVDSDVIEDLAGNNFVGISNTFYHFRTDDGQQPYVTNFTPKKNSLTATTCSCIEMVFDEDIQENSGTISLFKIDGTLVESVSTGTSDPRVEVQWNYANVDFNADFEELQEYYITVSEGAFGSFFVNDPSEAINAGDWTFTSKKEPYISILIPSDDAENVTTPSDLVIHFDVDVIRYSVNEANLLYLVDYDTDQVIETLDSENFSITDSIVTITYSTNLPPGAHVYIMADPDAFASGINGEGFNGLSAKDDWDFTIGNTSQRPNKTVWQTTTSNESIEIPVLGDSYYTVDWGDGQVSSGINGNAHHTYELPGIYEVKIYGIFPGFYFNNSGDKDKIISINQWGDFKFTNLEKAFYGCSNLTYSATDFPDLTNVNSLSYMFAGASVFNGEIGEWDISNISNISYMFANASNFNQNINSWDVSNVSKMTGLFQGASDYNQPLENWQVFRVTDMSSMFKNAISFDQPLNHWQVTSVVNFDSIFEGALSFNQNLANWRLFSAISLINAFNGSGISVRNYDLILRGWAGQAVKENVNLGANGLAYCNGEYARNSLINDFGWVITGDIQDCTEASFVTVWETTNVNESITIPTIEAGYSYTIDWGDGNITRNETSDATHVYSSPGNYEVKISGDFPRIYFNYRGDRKKIKSIKQWGHIQWTSMEDAFRGCTDMLLEATDKPDLTLVTSLRQMFSFCFLINADINDWDVSSVENMERTFEFCKVFNSPLNDWNTTNVTNTSYMFLHASEFNQDLDKWNMAKVEDISYMFWAATNFNSNISSWDVSKVTNMTKVFYQASSFNGDIGNWNVSSVIDMEGLFLGASSFNQDISSWDVSQVKYMKEMFRLASSFNKDISAWNVSNVRDMSHMFQSARAFNQPLNAWDLSSLIKLYGMFDRATSFNQDLNNWDISQVTDLNNVFRSADNFNGDISNWNVSNVQNMFGAFSYTANFNQDLSSWDVSNVTNMEGLFNSATSFDQDLSNWNVSAVTDMDYIFSYSAISTTNYDKILQGWSSLPNLQQNVDMGALGLTYCYSELSRQKIIDNYNWNITGDSLECNTAENGFVSTWKVNNNGESITIPTFGDGYNYDIDWGDGTLETGIMGSISHTYSLAGKYIITIKGSFPHIYFNNSGDKNKIESIDHWGNVQWSSMNNAFSGCENLIISASDEPDLTFVHDLSGMFSYCYSFNQDIGSWTVSSITNMSNMFYQASSFNQDLKNWDVSQVENMSEIFSGTSMSVENYDSLLIYWSALKGLNYNVEMGAEGLSFCRGKEERDLLINTYNWTITGDSEGCPNNPPSDITLTNNYIFEMNAVGDSIGTFGTIDVDTGDTFTYELISGSGDDDNSKFYVNNNVLHAAVSFDYEQQSAFTLRLQTNDGIDTYEKSFNIFIEDISNITQNITISVIPDKKVDDEPFLIEALTDSGLDLIYNVEGVASNLGPEITLDGIGGEVIVSITQPGDDDYASGFEQISFVVEKLEQFISINNIDDQYVFNEPIEIIAESTSNLPVNYALVGPAKLEQNIIILNGEEGFVEITAFQSGNSIFKEAVPVSIGFNVSNPCLDFNAEIDSINHDNGMVDVRIIGGLKPYSYNWSNGASTEDLFDLPSGLYNLTVTDSIGCITELEVTIEDIILSAADNLPSHAIAIYPVPANDIIYINSNEFSKKPNIEIELTDLNGVLCLKKQSSGKSLSIDVGDVPSGYYILTIKMGEHTVRRKTLIVH